MTIRPSGTIQNPRIGKKADDPGEDQHNPEWDPDPMESRLPQPADQPRRPVRQPALEAFQMLVEVLLVIAAHAR